MGEVDFGGMVTAFGPTGGLAAFVVWALFKSRFLIGGDTSRDDVLKAVKETNTSVRSTNDKIDKMDRELTDRLARIETMQSEHGRRITRLE